MPKSKRKFKPCLDQRKRWECQGCLGRFGDYWTYLEHIERCKKSY